MTMKYRTEIIAFDAINFFACSQTFERGIVSNQVPRTNGIYQPELSVGIYGDNPDDRNLCLPSWKHDNNWYILSLGLFSPLSNLWHNYCSYRATGKNKVIYLIKADILLERNIEAVKAVWLASKILQKLNFKFTELLECEFMNVCVTLVTILSILYTSKARSRAESWLFQATRF